MLSFESILARAPRGDPSPVAWLITLAYFVAAGLCIWAGRIERAQAIGRARQWATPLFWFILGGLLICLGFNKQLDLQSDLTQVGREIAREGGWYGSRRAVQAIFVVFFALGAIGAVAAAIWFLRDLWRRYRLAFIGIIFLCTFVIVRAASFHHVDQFLYHTSWAKYWFNTGLELGGNCLIIYAAWQATRPPPATKYRVYEKDVKIR